MHQGTVTVDFAPVGERLPVQVVLDPMPTVMTSVIELFGPFRSRLPPGLPRRAAALARGLDLAPLRTVLADPLHAGVPDFFAGLDRSHQVETVSDAVERLRSTPRDDVHRDVETYAGYSPLAARAVSDWRRDDRKALSHLADAVTTYWHGVLVPLYPDLEQRLRREARRLHDVVDELGPATATAGLHPGLDVDVVATSRLERKRPTPAHAQQLYRVDALLLKPMLCARRTSLSNLGFPVDNAAVFSCATPALFAHDSPPLPRDGLDMLVGRSRAGILRQLRERPITTTQLARVLRLAPSTVSQHLSALTGAGAVHPVRQGPEVLYLLTDRGHRLLEI